MKNKEDHLPFINIMQPTFDLVTKIETIYSSNDFSTLGLRTGFKNLDHILVGLRPSSLIVLASRPGIGKTSFAINIANYLGIREQMPLLYVNLAESKEAIVMKAISAESALDSHNIYQGILEPNDWTKLVNGADRFCASKLNILDAPIFNIRQLITTLRDEHAKKQYALIIIDYIQLMNGSEKYAGNRTQEVSEIGRSLKQLSSELNIPILVLSQLSRNLESRVVKKPFLSDLRDSGSLEDDADVVIFLYRDDYYNPDSEQKNIVDLIVAKNRFGPLNTTQVFFHRQFGKFMDLARDE